MVQILDEGSIVSPFPVLDHPVFKRLAIEPNQIRIFCQQYNIIEFSLFGSVLRDDFHDESDVDILIEFEAGYWLSWSVWRDLQDDLQQLVGRKVDVIRKELVTNPYVKAEIFKTRQVLYGKS